MKLRRASLARSLFCPLLGRRWLGMSSDIKVCEPQILRVAVAPAVPRVRLPTVAQQVLTVVSTATYYATASSGAIVTVRRYGMYEGSRVPDGADLTLCYEVKGFATASLALATTSSPPLEQLSNTAAPALNSPVPQPDHEALEPKLLQCRRWHC